VSERPTKALLKPVRAPSGGIAIEVTPIVEDRPEFGKQYNLTGKDSIAEGKTWAEAEVKPASGMEIVEQFHSKRGHNVYIVTMVERVERDKYNELAKAARMLGGKYSREWKPTKSPAGFVFNKREQAEAFVNSTEKKTANILDSVAKRQSDLAKAFQQDGRSAVLPEAEDPLANDFRDIILSGESPLQKTLKLKKIAGTAEKIKGIQERVEVQLVKIARDMVKSHTGTIDELFTKLKDLYQRQPLLGARTSTSVEMQQYSTPAPLAFLLDYAMNLGQAKTVYEPTAGNAMLLIGAGLGSKITANEIDAVRRKGLRSVLAGENPTITGEDATKEGVGPASQVDAMISNPPFYSIPVVNYEGYKITRAEHLIALRALESMKDDGVAGLILAAGREEGKVGAGADTVFFNYLYGHFNVVDAFDVSGDLYSRQGASWPVRVVVIAGRRANPEVAILSPKKLDFLRNWADIINRGKEIRHEIETRREVLGPGRTGTDVVHPGKRPTTTENVGGVPVASSEGVGKAGRGDAGGRGRAGIHADTGSGRGPALDHTGTDGLLDGLLPLNRPASADEPVVQGTPGQRPPAGVEEGRGGRTGDGERPAIEGEERGGDEGGSGRLDSVGVRGTTDVKASDLSSLSADDMSALFDEVAAEVNSDTKKEIEAPPAKADIHRKASGRPTAIKDKIEVRRNSIRRRINALVRPILLPRSERKFIADPAGIRIDNRIESTPSDERSAIKSQEEVIKSAIKEAGAGVEDSMNGLYKLFGGGKRLNMAIPMPDEDSWAEAKPHLQSSFDHFVKSGKSIKEWVSFLIKQFGDSIQPYLMRFHKEMVEMKGKIKQLPVFPKQNETQDVYLTMSEGDPMVTLAPAGMAQGIRNSLNKLVRKVGDIDKHVAGKLGMTIKELHQGLGAEQVDGVALAIDQIESGDAMINGDETGIGKGRQIAALIRYAQKSGMVPVFFTKDAKLFSDMYGDGKAIGSVFKPLLIGNEKEGDIRSNSGATLVKVPTGAKRAKAFSAIMENGFGKSGHDSVFVAYSQIHRNGAQQRFLDHLANNENTLILMDEAHEASGDKDTSMTAAFFAGGDIKRGSGASRITIKMPGILRAPGVQRGKGGVAYFSATYAKRPDNMGAYFRTVLGRAAHTMEEMIDTIKDGGVAMQQAISEALAKAGQMIRRERDFSGVPYEMKTVGQTNKSEYQGKADAITEQLEAIVDFSSRMVSHIKESNTRLRGTAQSRKSLAMTEFSSRVHNQIGQMLLAMKVDDVVNEAVESVKRGEKPIVTFHNTMEGFLSDYAREHEIRDGDAMDLSWRSLLLNALESVCYASQKTPEGDSIKIRVEPSTIGLGAEYEELKETIRSMKIDMYASPIDGIRSGLEQAGITFGEITGRKERIDYQEGSRTKGIYHSFKRESKGSLVDSFNTEKTQALFFNGGSGAIGISLHASRKFTENPKPRHMFIVQPNPNISDLVQALGRIRRTGMVEGGAQYTHMVLPLQAEIRPGVMALKKMKSLNANTKSEGGSGINIEFEDMVNKFGDMVMAEYLYNNEDMARRLDADPIILDPDTGEYQHEDDLTQKMTGHMAYLPDSVQFSIYKEIIAQYKDMIEQVKTTGEYDLEIVVHKDWNAVKGKVDQLLQGLDDSNMLTSGVEAQEWNIRDARHVPTGNEMQEAIKRRWGDDALSGAREELKAFEAKAQEAVKFWHDYANKDARSAATSREVLERWNHTKPMIRRMVEQVGSVMYFEGIAGTITKIIYPREIAGRVGLSAGGFKFQAMINNPIGKAYFTGAKVLSHMGPSESSKDFDDLNEVEQNRRVDRVVLTGNPFEGHRLAGDVGQMVRFDTEKEGVVTGRLMPNEWERGALLIDPTVELTSSDAAIKYVRSYPIEEFDKDRVLLIAKGNVSVYIKAKGNKRVATLTVPASKRTGGDYYLNETIRNVIGDFTKQRQRMGVSNISMSDLGKVLPEIERIAKERFRAESGDNVSEKQRAMLVKKANTSAGASPQLSIARATGSWDDFKRGEKVFDEPKLRVYKGTRKIFEGEDREIYETQIKVGGHWLTVQYANNSEEARTVADWDREYSPEEISKLLFDRSRRQPWYAVAMERGISPAEIFADDPAIVKLIESGESITPLFKPPAEYDKYQYSLGPVNADGVVDLTQEPGTDLAVNQSAAKNELQGLSDLIDTDNINIIERQDQLPAEIQQAAKGDIQRSGLTRIEGVHDRDVIHIVLENIRDVAHFRAKVLHEVFHRGIRRVTGDQKSLNKVLNSTLGTLGRKMELANIARNRGLDLRDVADYRMAVDELIAKITEERVRKPNVFNRMVAAIRQALRDRGYIKELTDNDVDWLITRALTAGKVNPVRAGAQLSLAGERAQVPTFYSQLARVIDGIKMPRMTVGQLKGIIAKGGVKKDELFWTGLDEFIKGKQDSDKVTKDEVRAQFSLADDMSTEDIAAMSEMVESAKREKDRAAGIGFTVGKAEAAKTFRERYDAMKAKAKDRQEKAVLGARIGERAKGRKEGVKAGIHIGFERGEVVGKTLSVEDSVKLSFQEVAKKRKQHYQDALFHFNKLLTLMDLKINGGIDADGTVIEKSIKPDQVEPYQRGVLKMFFGDERFNAMRRSSKGEFSLTLSAVRDAMSKELAKHYVRAFERLLTTVKPDRMLPEYKVTWNAAVADLGPDTYGRKNWQEAKEKFEELSKIFLNNRNDQKSQQNASKYNARSMGQAAAAEVIESLPEIKGLEEKTPQRRGFFKTYLADKSGNFLTRALTLSGGKEKGSPNVDILLTALRKGETKALQTTLDSITDLNSILEKNGITESKVIDMRAELKPVAISGEEVKMTSAEKIDLAASWLVPESRDMIIMNGWESERRKGQLEARVMGNTVEETADMVNEVLATLTPAEREISEAMVRIVTAMGKAGNEVSTIRDGWERFTRKVYWPRKVDRTTTQQTMGAGNDKDPSSWAQLHNHKTLNSLGFTKELQMHTHPLTMGDAFDKFYYHVNMMSRYSHLNIPSYEAMRLLGNPDFGSAVRTRLGEEFLRDYRTMIERVSGLSGYVADTTGVQRMFDKFSRNAAVSILWYRLTSIIYNRVGGAMLATAEIYHKYPNQVGRFMARTAMPISLRTRHAKEVIEKFMANGYLGQRWGHDMSRVYAPLGYERYGDVGKTKFKMQWRRMQEFGMKPMARAEMRTAIAVYEVAIRAGLSEEAAVHEVESVIRATQNPSSAIDESIIYMKIRSSGFGGLVPFLGQPVVSRNMVLRDHLLLQGAKRRGDSARIKEARKNLAMTVSALASNLVLEIVVRSTMRAMRQTKPPDDEDEAKEKEILRWVVDVAINICDFLLPSSGRVFDYIRGIAANFRGARDPSMVGAALFKTYHGFRRIISPYSGVNDEYDAEKLERGIVDLLEGSGMLMGGPTGGPLVYYKLTRGLLSDGGRQYPARPQKYVPPHQQQRKDFKKRYQQLRRKP